MEPAKDTGLWAVTMNGEQWAMTMAALEGLENQLRAQLEASQGMRGAADLAQIIGVAGQTKRRLEAARPVQEPAERAGEGDGE